MLGYSHFIVRILWSISYGLYGPYDMTYMIWPIWYGLYDKTISYVIFVMVIWIKHIVLSTTNMVSIFLLYDYHPFVVSLFGFFSQFLTRLNPKMHDEMNLVVLVISIIWDFWLFPNIFQKILLKYFIKTLKHTIYGPYHMDHMIWYLGRIPRNFKTFIWKPFLRENHKKW